MVLHFCGCGRVGHRRFIFEKDPVSKDAGSFVASAEVVVSTEVTRGNRYEYFAKLACCVCRGLMDWIRFFSCLGYAVLGCVALGHAVLRKTHMVTRCGWFGGLNEV